MQKKTTAEWISTKPIGRMGHGPRKRPCNVGVDPDEGADTGMLYCFLQHCKTFSQGIIHRSRQKKTGILRRQKSTSVRNLVQIEFKGSWALMDICALLSEILVQSDIVGMLDYFYWVESEQWFH